MAIVRSIKNIAKGFSDVQIKVREATSNDPWGPSGTLMNEIAQLTFNESDFIEIMDMIDKRLNDKGKNWRHVFKALLLLDYCLHVGSENVVLYAKENIYVVKTLKEFQHLEENGKDVGANVRQKAKDISNLLMDENRLKEERRQRQGMRDRMANIGDYLNESVRRINGEEEGEERWNDEAELKKALAESKRIAAEEERNRVQGDDDLAKALQLSEQEAFEKEQKKKQNSAMNDLLGTFSTPTTTNPYQQPLQLEWTQQPNQFSEPFTTTNNPYQFNNVQAQMTGFPIQQQQQQQQQPTTMDFFSNNNNNNNQFNTVQAQMTGFPATSQNAFQPAFQQPQTTFQQQQPSFLQMQPTGFAATQQQPSFQTSMVTGTNPFSQLSSTTTSIQPQQPQQQHDYSSLVFGNPTSAPLQQQQTSPFMTTNNNSNAPNFGFTTPQTISSPSMSFNTTPSFNSVPSPRMVSSPTPQPIVQQQDNSKYAKLNALLANKDDGMDTFGNQGNLRIPVGTGFANGFKPTETKNPFGQVSESPKPQGQKSLLDLMQEQKQQQQQFF